MCIVCVCAQVRGMLQDIATLDTASHTASYRLRTLRDAAHPRAEQQLLEGHISEIEKEKAILTNNLPTLIRYAAHKCYFVLTLTIARDSVRAVLRKNKISVSGN